MNENIKRLWNVAAEMQSCFDSNDWDAHVKFLNDFAELIVKECADQCTTEGPFGAEVVWGNQFHKKIKEHFGVE